MNARAAMTAEQIERLIVNFIREELADDQSLQIDPDDNLLTGGIIDSVGIVRLVAHLKEQLGVAVPPKDLVPDNFRSIRTMAAYMQGVCPKTD